MSFINHESLNTITLFILVNKDHFYRGTSTTYILHYYIQCSALQWIITCFTRMKGRSDGKMRQETEGKRRSGSEGGGL